MPRIETSLQDEEVAVNTSTDIIQPQSSTRLTPRDQSIESDISLVQKTEVTDDAVTTRLPITEPEPLTIQDFQDNPEVQERAYRAINYLYNDRYDDKTKAVDKYIDIARQNDFNLISAGLAYRDLLQKQKREDAPSKQYIDDISWLYNEFYSKDSQGKDKYKVKGLKQRAGLTGDILQGAVTDLTNWAMALTFPFTGGQSATAQVVASQAAKSTLKNAMKNAASKAYKTIPKVSIDPRSYKQVTALTTGEGFVMGSTDNYLRQKRFIEMGVDGYETFSPSEVLITGGYGAAIGFGIGNVTNFGYKYFDSRAIRNKQKEESENFENLITDNFDKKQNDVEIVVPQESQIKPREDVKIISDADEVEPRPDVEIVTLEKAATESKKLREENNIPESSHVEQVLDIEATTFDTPNIKNAGKVVGDEEPEIIIVDGQARNKENPNQKIIVGGKISRKTFDEASSTYFIFGKPTTYSAQLAKIDPNFEEFLRYIRHDSTESVFDNPLKVVNDKLYQNRSYMETTRDIAGTQVAKLMNIKENLENTASKYDRYSSRKNFKMKSGTALNNDLYKFLNTGRFDGDVPQEVVKAGYELRKIFDSLEKQAKEEGFVFHSIENFFPRYWKPGAITKSNENKKLLAEQLVTDEGMNISEAYQAVDSLVNKMYDDLDPSIGSLGQRAYKKLNTVPLQNLLTDDVYAVTFLYANSMARKIARKKLFGFGEQEFNRKWIIPFFGGTLQRTSSQEGRDAILERLSAQGFSDSLLEQSSVKEFVRLNFTLRQLGKDLPDEIDDILKLKNKEIESLSKKEKDNKQLRKDFKNFKNLINDINKLGLTKDEQALLKNEKFYNVIDKLINERINANDFILKTSKVEGTLSEKNVDYRNTLKRTNASASAEKERIIKLHNYIVGIDGLPQNSLSKGVNGAVNAILTTQAMNKLGLATISSFPEMFVPLLKAAPKPTVQAFLKTVNSEVTRLFKNIFTSQQGRTLSRQELNEFNLVLKGSLAEAVQSSYSEGLGKYSAKVTYNFYRGILLDQYTKFVQIFAYNTAKIMINDNLEALSKLSAKQIAGDSKEVVKLKLPLVQLGIDIDRALKWYKSGQRTDDLYYESIKASGARFVDEVVMNPAREAAQKPLFMTHWLGRLVFQLFSYPVAFGNTIVRNSARDIALAMQIKDTITPARIMATYAMMLGMTRLSRGIKTGGKSLEEEYNAESMLKDLDTLGVGGPLSLAYGYSESKKYGRNTFRAISETVGGPTFGSALADFYQSKRGLTSLTKHMQPLRNVIVAAHPELQFEIDQLIKDIEDSMAQKTEFEKQLRRQEDFLKFQKKQAGLQDQEFKLKEEKERIGKVVGGIVEGPEVPFAKENPADRINPYTGEPYQEQMDRLGFEAGGPIYLGGGQSSLYNVAAKKLGITEKQIQDNYSIAARIVNTAVDRGLVGEQERIPQDKDGNYIIEKTGDAFNAVNHAVLSYRVGDTPIRRTALQAKEVLQAFGDAANSELDRLNNSAGFDIRKIANTEKEREELIYNKIKERQRKLNNRIPLERGKDMFFTFEEMYGEI